MMRFMVTSHFEEMWKALSADLLIEMVLLGS